MPRAINDYQYEKFIQEYTRVRDSLRGYLDLIDYKNSKYILHCIERMIDAKIAMAMHELNINKLTQQGDQE